MKLHENVRYEPRSAPFENIWAENIWAVYIKDGEEVPKLGDQLWRPTSVGRMLVELVEEINATHFHDRTLYVFRYRRISWQKQGEYS